MQPNDRLAVWGKLIIPLFMLILLGAFPVPWAVMKGQRAVVNAQQAGSHQRIAENLRVVLAHQPWRVDLWEQIGLEELAAGRLSQAAEAFRQAEARGILSNDSFYRLGDVYFQQSDGDAAETTWETLLKKGDQLTPGLAAKTFERLAQLQRSKGDFQAAVQTLRSWRSVDPANPQVAFILGSHLCILQPDQALGVLLESSRLDSKYTPSVQKLRTGIGLAGESGNSAYGWVMIGRALGDTGQWDLAMVAFIKAEEANPQYAEAWAFHSEALFQLGKDGKSALDHALVLNPNSALVRALAALAYRRQGKFDQALTYLQAVATQEPDEPVWEVELASTWAEKGDLPTALEHFQKAVALSPDNTYYWQRLARFSADYSMNPREIGLPAARQAILLSPHDPAALDVMGWTLVTLSDLATAERFLQQAVDSDPAYALAFLHLGQLYLQNHDMERAYSNIKRAHLLAGDGPIGLVAKRLLQQYYGEGK